MTSESSTNDGATPPPPAPHRTFTKEAITAIDSAALVHAAVLLPPFSLEGHREGNEWVARNPQRNDKNPGSFKFNIISGLWADFAGSEKDRKKHRGGGLVSYVAHNRNMGLSAAAALVLDALSRLGIAPEESAPVAPTDDDITWEHCPAPMPPPEARFTLPDLGAPSHTYIYHDDHRRIAGIVVRWDRPDGGKEISPLTPWVHADGELSWRWKHIPHPRPLFNLIGLLDQPQAPVLIVEGEKAAMAARALAPDYVVVTWIGGAEATNLSNWTPLIGRDITFWPDNDAAGSTAALSIVSWLEGQGTGVRVLTAAEIAKARQRILDRSAPPGTPRCTDALPGGYDAADALAEGWVANDLAGLLDIAPLPRHYVERDGCIYYYPSEEDAEEGRGLKICQHIDVLAWVRTATGSSWGRLIRWFDGDGVEHTWALPMALLANDGKDLRARLLDEGFYLCPHRDVLAHFIDLLLNSVPRRRLRCVEKVGWHDTIFVLGDCHGTVLRPDGHSEGVILQTTTPLKPLVATGTIEGWREHVAARCLGNSRLIFAACLGFAGYVMRLVDASNGGYHIVGRSSSGKTTALWVTNSVTGCQIKTWRITENAMEAIAALHNDGVLLLDEIKECPPDRIGETVYMLGNGSGKARMTKGIQLREPLTWTMTFLSTGEITLADILRDHGQDTHIGQEVRFCDIPADAGAGHGCFEDLHGEVDGHAFSMRLAEAVKAQTGMVGPAFIAAVVRDRVGAQTFLRDLMATFCATAVPPTSEGQVKRVATRFALAAAAGELAGVLGLTGWPPGTAGAAVQTCFQAWLDQRPSGLGSGEEAQVVERIRQVIIREAAAFEPLTLPPSGMTTPRSTPQVTQRIGWFRMVDGCKEYLFPSPSWKRIFKGINPRLATVVLRRLGYLIPSSSGESSQPIAIPSMGPKAKVRVYVVAATVLADAAGTEEQIGM